MASVFLVHQRTIGRSTNIAANHAASMMSISDPRLERLPPRPFLYCRDHCGREVVRSSRLIT